MSQPYMPVMFHFTGLNGSTSLSDLHLATLTRDAVHTWASQPQVIFHRTEESRDFPLQQANTLHLVFGQHAAEAAVCRLDIPQESD